MATPARGEVWEDDSGRRLLIISANFWNRLAVDEVVVVQISELEGDPSDEMYVPVVRAANRRWEVFADVLFSVAKTRLQEWVLTFDDAAMRHVSYVVRAELLPNPGDPATLEREARLTGRVRPREERRREVYARTLSDPVWRKP